MLRQEEGHTHLLLKTPPKSKKKEKEKREKPLPCWEGGEKETRGPELCFCQCSLPLSHDDHTVKEHREREAKASSQTTPGSQPQTTASKTQAMKP